MNKYPLFLLSAEMRPWLVMLVIIDLVLKGFSLYRSAKKDQTVWFVALLLVNSLGVLPLIYLLIENGVEKNGKIGVVKNVTKKVVVSKKKTRK